MDLLEIVTSQHNLKALRHLLDVVESNVRGLRCSAFRQVTGVEAPAINDRGSEVRWLSAASEVVDSRVLPARSAFVFRHPFEKSRSSRADPIDSR